MDSSIQTHAHTLSWMSLNLLGVTTEATVACALRGGIWPASLTPWMGPSLWTTEASLEYICTRTARNQAWIFRTRTLEAHPTTTTESLPRTTTNDRGADSPKHTPLSYTLRVHMRRTTPWSVPRGIRGGTFSPSKRIQPLDVFTTPGPLGAPIVSTPYHPHVPHHTKWSVCHDVTTCSRHVDRHRAGAATPSLKHRVP